MNKKKKIIIGQSYKFSREVIINYLIFCFSPLPKSSKKLNIGKDKYVNFQGGF